MLISISLQERFHHHIDLDFRDSVSRGIGTSLVISAVTKLNDAILGPAGVPFYSRGHQPITVAVDSIYGASSVRCIRAFRLLDRGVV